MSATARTKRRWWISLACIAVLASACLYYARYKSRRWLARRASSGDIGAMVELADQLLQEGQIPAAIGYLAQAAEGGSDEALARLEEFAESHPEGDLGLLAHYAIIEGYWVRGELERAFDACYRFAEGDPQSFALQAALLYIFADVGKSGEGYVQRSRRRARECLELLAADNGCSYLYPFMMDLTEDGLIEAPSPEVLKQWRQAAAQASDRDIRILSIQLRVALPQVEQSSQYQEYREKWAARAAALPRAAVTQPATQPK